MHKSNKGNVFNLHQNKTTIECMWFVCALKYLTVLAYA